MDTSKTGLTTIIESLLCRMFGLIHLLAEISHHSFNTPIKVMLRVFSTHVFGADS